MANVANSLLEEDKTLPVDFDGSCNPNHLPEVTFGPLSDNGNSLAVSKGNGRMSPLMACTMKEYDQKIDELKKENFNLKLRIYFLEEKIQHKFDGDSEQLLRTNIELKVDFENAKKDLAEKQGLLKKASTALETIAAQQEVELAQAQQKAKQEVAAQQHLLEHEVSELQDKLSKRDQDLAGCQQELDASTQRLREVLGVQKQLNAALRTSETRRQELQLRLDDLEDGEPQSRRISGAEDLHSKDKVIEQLKNALKTKELILEQTEEEKKEVQQPLQARILSLEKQLINKEAQIQSLQDRKEDKEADVEESSQQSEQGLKGLDDGVGNCLSQEKENLINDLEKKLQDCEKVIKTHEENALKRDKAIQGLAKVLMQKDAEILTLSEAGGGDKLKNLESTLGRRDGEIHRLHKQVEKAEQQLNQREDALQILLDDQQRQIENQEKMIQRLTKSVQGKDKQIQDMIQAEGAVGEHDSRNVLLENLKQQLVDKDRAMEEILSDRNKALEDKEAELRQLKASVRERDVDIERANQMLLTTEDMIDGLERESKEKDATMKQLVETVKAQEKALEDAAESHEQALSEKESLIERLRGSLTSTEQKFQDSVRQSISSSDVVAQQLQKELQEREDLLQELLSDRQRTADVHDRTTKELLKRMRERDEQFKEQEHDHQEELSQLHRQMQGLQADLNKRDYELQTLENKATWTEESQQERLDKLRAALHEKDRTIESLVDSGREKDKVIRQLQTTFGADDGPTPDSWQSAKIQAEMQQLKDEVALQADAIQNKDGLIERLQSAVNRLSPKPEMVPRIRLKDVEEKLEETEEEALRTELASAHRSIPLCAQCGERRSTDAAMSACTGTPQRTQTPGGNTAIQSSEESHLLEINSLIDALKTKHDVYLNITNAQAPGPSRDAPDAAVAFEIELRAVQALRQQLEEGIQHNRDVREALATKAAIGTEGDEDASDLRRQVKLLQTQLEESQRWAESLQARLQQGGGVRDTGVGGNSESQPLPTEFRQGVYAASRGTSPNNSTWMPEDSFLPSFMSICRSPAINDLMPSDEALSGMSSEDLHRLLLELRDFISAASAAGNQMAPPKDEAVLPSVAAREAQLQEQIASLAAQLQHAENLNSLLKRQIELDTRTADKPSGFNPELLMEMAREIKELKAKVTEPKHNKSEVTDKDLQIMGTSATDRQIDLPTLGTSSTNRQYTELEAIQLELSKAKGEISELQGTLASTEATVRSQADRMKGYRRQLTDAGIVPITPTRSRSESSLHQAATQDNHISRASAMAELEKFDMFGKTTDVSELHEQIKELQEYLKRRTVKSKRMRSLSISSSCSSGAGSSVTSDETTSSHSRPHSGVSQIPVLSSRLRSKSGPQAPRKKGRSQSLDDGSSHVITSKEKINQRKKPGKETITPDHRETEGLDEQEKARLEQEPDTDLSSVYTELSALSQYADELLHQDRHGDVDLIDITPDRVMELKQRLRDMTRRIGNITKCKRERDSVDGSQSAATVSPLPSSVDKINNDLRHKYTEAQKEIKSLQEQLDQCSKRQDGVTYPPPTGPSADHRQELALLELENEMLKQKVDGLQDKITQLQDELSAEHSVQASSQKEALDTIQRLHKQVKGLKVKVTDAEAQKDAIQRLAKAAQEENKELQNRLTHEKKLQNRLTQEAMERDRENKNWKEQVQRMTGDVAERDRSVAILKQRLEDLQNRQISEGAHTVSQKDQVSQFMDSTSVPQHGAKTFGSSVEWSCPNAFVSREQFRKESTASIERVRHATAESLDAPLVPPLLSPDYIDIAPSSSSAMVGSENRGKASVTADVLAASQASTESLLPISLQTQLQMVEELNETMHEIYEQVHQQEESMAECQESPTATRVTRSTRDVSSDTDYPSQPDLAKYFEEMQALRRKLEESISKNDVLRASLRKRADSSNASTKEIRVNVEIVETMKKEITSLTTQLHTRTQQMANINREVDHLRSDLQQKSRDLIATETNLKSAHEANLSLQKRLDQEQATVQALEQKLCRLQEESSKLRDQLSENADLNRTLKMELSMYDRLTAEPARGSGVDVSLERMLLSELTQLRIQLERSIESNNALREKLEEHLAASPAKAAGTVADINVNITETKVSKVSSHYDTLSHVSAPDLHGNISLDGNQMNGLRGHADLNSKVASETDLMDSVLRYNIKDPSRPPGEPQQPNSPPTHDTDKSNGLCHINGEVNTSVRVSSDVRSLYALGALDDYELLKKQICEASCLLAGLNAMLASQRAGASPTSSPRRRESPSPTRSLEGSTLRRVASSVDNLHTVVQEQQRLVGLFWVSTLPQTEGVATSTSENVMARKNYELTLQLVKVQKKYQRAKEALMSVTDKLEMRNKRREVAEASIIQQLEETHMVLQKAKQNLSQW